MLRFIYYTLSIAFFYTTTAQAGWFGPSNYQECVLDKMKGQPMYLLQTAEDACMKSFPRSSECYVEKDKCKAEAGGNWDGLYSCERSFLDCH